MKWALLKHCLIYFRTYLRMASSEVVHFTWHYHWWEGFFGFYRIDSWQRVYQIMMHRRSPRRPPLPKECKKVKDTNQLTKNASNNVWYRQHQDQSSKAPTILISSTYTYNPTFYESSDSYLIVWIKYEQNWFDGPIGMVYLDYKAIPLQRQVSKWNKCKVVNGLNDIVAAMAKNNRNGTKPCHTTIEIVWCLK